MKKILAKLLIVSTVTSLFLSLLTGCRKKDLDINLISIESIEAGSVTLSLTNNISVHVKATLVDHNSYVKKYFVGFCWALHPNPTIKDHLWSTSCSNTGSFGYTIEHLQQDTLYYVRFFVQSESDVKYGNEISFTTPTQYEKKVGDQFQGGIIAYIFQPGEPPYVENEFHGLIVAPNDQSAGVRWQGLSGSGPLITSMDIGVGAQNTTNIINYYSATSTDYAAKLCDNLVLNGYTDWFLPSIGDLKKIMKYKNDIGGFSDYDNPYYWSSSELTNFSQAYAITSDEYVFTDSKIDENRVRATRQF